MTRRCAGREASLVESAAGCDEVLRNVVSPPALAAMEQNLLLYVQINPRDVRRHER